MSRICLRPNCARSASNLRTSLSLRLTAGAFAEMPGAFKGAAGRARNFRVLPRHIKALRRAAFVAVCLVTSTAMALNQTQAD